MSGYKSDLYRSQVIVVVFSPSFMSQVSGQSEQDSPTQSSPTLLTAVSLANALGMQLGSLNSSTTTTSQQQQQQQQGHTSGLTAAQMMMV